MSDEHGVATGKQYPGNAPQGSATGAGATAGVLYSECSASMVLGSMILSVMMLTIAMLESTGLMHNSPWKTGLYNTLVPQKHALQGAALC